ncbi:MAG: 30S ribosomal protein S3 [Bacilli bacterium]|nr:30S ribosomal protein S3 [Bacilli bacterium]
MGQKINAVGFRIGVNRDWEAHWFASNKDFSKYLGQDIKIREYLEPKLKDAVVSHIEIARKKDDKRGAKVIVTCHVARPGVALGQEGANLKVLVAGLKKAINEEVVINIAEVEAPDLDAVIVAKWIASELENRQSFRSTQKKAIQRMKKAGALGCRTQCQGRLGGAEIARREGYKEGVVPLETLRADIDYAHVPAATAYGNIGVKVWVCRPGERKEEAEKKQPSRRQGGFNHASTKTR